MFHSLVAFPTKVFRVFGSTSLPSVTLLVSLPLFAMLLVGNVAWACQLVFFSSVNSKLLFYFVIFLPSSLSCGYPCLFDPQFGSYFHKRVTASDSYEGLVATANNNQYGWVIFSSQSPTQKLFLFMTLLRFQPGLAWPLSNKLDRSTMGPARNLFIQFWWFLCVKWTRNMVEMVWQGGLPPCSVVKRRVLPLFRELVITPTQ